jgi:hypothetical protein
LIVSNNAVLDCYLHVAGRLTQSGTDRRNRSGALRRCQGEAKSCDAAPCQASGLSVSI